MFNLLKRLFSGKKNTESNDEPLLVRAQSQPHVLQYKMMQEKINHGQTIEANLRFVRIVKTNTNGYPDFEGQLTAFFCPLERIEVISRLTPGDNQPIPEAVEIHNLKLPSNMKTGIYNINNVLLHANGSINVMATQHTTLEMVDA